MYFIRDEQTTTPVNDAEPFDHCGISLFSHRVDNEYRVTEATTGLMISASQSKEDAITKAKYYISKKPDFIKEKIKEALKRIASESQLMISCEI